MKILIEKSVFFCNSFSLRNAIYGADSSTEMTAYALRAEEDWLSCFSITAESLMPCVIAGDVASAAADTLVFIENRICNGVTVKAAGIGHILVCKADCIRHTAVACGSEPA